MSKLTNAGSKRNKVGAGDVGSTLDKGLTDIVDFILVKTEAIAARIGVWALKRGVLNNILEVVSRELEDLLEYCCCLCFIQRSHLGLEQNMELAFLSRLKFWPLLTDKQDI